ncbi:MAG: acetate--CoA ligase family protein [Syntrophales bacterium]|nr:acetate--CoA ligase family protein [Syntrophales bacterium]
MNPKSIATVGAGNNPDKMGTFHAANLLKSGYQGKFYPVHPEEKIVLGHKAYASVSDLPEAPDLALLIVPAHQVASLLEAFGKIGTRRAIVITAGFREIGAEGKKLEEEVVNVAKKYGIRFVGPNCIGTINTRTLINTTVAPHANRLGRLGLASHSGTYIAQTFFHLNRRGIRYSRAISLGNEASITIVDALEYLGEDEDTKAIILYIEGIREGRRFIEVAQRITPHKPVLALYAGGSVAGAKAGMSHTGAMAGPDFLYDGIFRQAGIIRVQTIEELYGHGWALATQPPLRGSRLGIVTNSGGPGTSISHTANVGGLDIPTFTETLQEQIRKRIHGHAASANPVDLTFTLDKQALGAGLPEMVMKSDEVDCLIIHGVMDRNANVYPDADGNLDNSPPVEVSAEDRLFLSASVSLPGKYKKPMLMSSFFDRRDSFMAFYEDHDIPVYDVPEKAARAMADLLKYKKVRERKVATAAPMPPPSADAEKLVNAALKRGQKSLDEYEAKQILSAYGIPVTRERLATTEDEVVAAAREIGFPLALKGCSPDILHKTGKGLIRLGVAGEDETINGFRAIRNAADKAIPVLVQEMIPGSRELMMGMTRFPAFGPVLLFGLGGIFTEVLKDVAFRAAPLSLEEAEEMVYDIRAGKMLEEFRGIPAVDIAALADILQRLGFISMLHPGIAEMDLNPLIVSGSKPIVADALIIINGKQ